MGPLEEELQRAMYMAAISTPSGLRALTEGPQDLDAMQFHQQVVVPMLIAQRDAILRLARHIDES